mmetsp:Transcript_10304/g.14367  ORF Transcript_10304/g.14367 Transcript_10304/m.14367 type:complete len:82 (+) Transcript_10304:287-532(+)
MSMISGCWPPSPSCSAKSSLPCVLSLLLPLLAKGEGGEGGGSSFVSEAMMFVQEVKTEYQGSSVYYDFLDILKDYRAKPYS